MITSWLSYDAPIDGPQIVASLAHALRASSDPRLTPAGVQMLSRVVWERYQLCHDVGLGTDADTLVFKHRFEVAR